MGDGDGDMGNHWTKKQTTLMILAYVAFIGSLSLVAMIAYCFPIEPRRRGDAASSERAADGGVAGTRLADMSAV